MKYFQSTPFVAITIAMIFWGYAYYQYTMKMTAPMTPILIGLGVIVAGFGYSYWRYRLWDDEK
ncbi:MAG: hypothetical protein AB8F95_17995 [Bacteroidia bacterium]